MTDQQDLVFPDIFLQLSQTLQVETVQQFGAAFVERPSLASIQKYKQCHFFVHPQHMHKYTITKAVYQGPATELLPPTLKGMHLEWGNRKYQPKT